jgi:hypothetical protein
LQNVLLLIFYPCFEDGTVFMQTLLFGFSSFATHFLTVLEICVQTLMRTFPDWLQCETTVANADLLLWMMVA